MTLFVFSAFPPASTNFSLSERSQPQDQGTKAPCLLPDALGNTKLPYLSSISTVFSSTAILPSNSKTLRKPRSNLHFQQLNQAQCSKMYYKKNPDCNSHIYSISNTLWDSRFNDSKIWRQKVKSDVVQPVWRYSPGNQSTLMGIPFKTKQKTHIT